MAVEVRGAPQASRQTHRNLLILGAATLLVLGGIGFFLVSQKSGDTHTTIQNIRNEIIHNSYFQNLNATGVTTRKDLETISWIRPYGDGFIGISAESLEWYQANDLAGRTGSMVLELDPSRSAADMGVLNWLVKELPDVTASPLWVTKDNRPAVFATTEVIPLNGSDGSRRVVMHWQMSFQPGAPHGGSALVIGGWPLTRNFVV